MSDPPLLPSPRHWGSPPRPVTLLNPFPLLSLLSTSLGFNPSAHDASEPLSSPLSPQEVADLPQVATKTGTAGSAEVAAADISAWLQELEVWAGPPWPSPPHRCSPKTP